MRIIWAKHSEDRQREWEKKKGITRLEVEELIKNPEQIVLGDMDVLVAQSRNRNGVLRVPFVKKGNDIKVLTGPSLLDRDRTVIVFQTGRSNDRLEKKERTPYAHLFESLSDLPDDFLKTDVASLPCSKGTPCDTLTA